LPSLRFGLVWIGTISTADSIHGKAYYFGKVIDDPQGEKALKLWLDQKDDLLAGRIPKARKKLPERSRNPQKKG